MTTTLGVTLTDAFDSDVLIFASKGDRRGDKAVAALRTGGSAIGSVLLLPETLSKPFRVGDVAESAGLSRLLAQIELKVLDEDIADAAVTLGAKYRLKAADAVHLATAVVWGADRFHTSNRRDFGGVVDEIDVVFA